MMCSETEGEIGIHLKCDGQQTPSNFPLPKEQLLWASTAVLQGGGYRLGDVYQVCEVKSSLSLSAFTSTELIQTSAL